MKSLDSAQGCKCVSVSPKRWGTCLLPLNTLTLMLAGIVLSSICARNSMTNVGCPSHGRSGQKSRGPSCMVKVFWKLKECQPKDPKRKLPMPHVWVSLWQGRVCIGVDKPLSGTGQSFPSQKSCRLCCKIPAFCSHSLLAAPALLTFTPSRHHADA